MKRLAAALSTAFLLLSAMPALADGYGHGHRGYGYGYGYSHGYGYGHGYGYRHGHYGYRRYHGYGGGYGYAIAGALVGGAIVGSLLTQPTYYAPPRPIYVPAPPVLGNFLATTGIGYVGGRQARFGGTMCFDQYGRGYIMPGSQYFIGYLQ